jgi:hypothetical protein
LFSSFLLAERDLQPIWAELDQGFLQFAVRGEGENHLQSSIPVAVEFVDSQGTDDLAVIGSELAPNCLRLSHVPLCMGHNAVSCELFIWACGGC